jgi:hypothetical protein
MDLKNRPDSGRELGAVLPDTTPEKPTEMSEA